MEKSIELTATEKLALSVISQEFTVANQSTKKAQDDLAAFKADFAKSRPGWQFDEQKGIVKIEAPKK